MIFMGYSLIVTAAVWLLAAIIGFRATAYEIGERRGKAFLVASLLFAVGLIIPTIAAIFLEASSPVNTARGTIQSVRLKMGARSEDATTYVILRTDSGEEFVGRALGESRYFQPGQLVEIAYRVRNNEIIKARFFSANGTEEGQFRGGMPVFLGLFLLAGVLVVWGALAKYRRNPAGRDEPDWHGEPRNTFDEDSLLKIRK